MKAHSSAHHRLTTEPEKLLKQNSPSGHLPAVVYIIALTQFVLPFMYSGVTVTLPALGLEFAASGVTLALIETVYLGAGAAFLLPLGCIAEKTDKRTLFRIGLLVYAIATVTIGALPSTESILAVRFIQGIASAFMGATVMAILFEATPSGARGKAIGLSMGAVYLGLAAGPLVAGIITTQFGWRWVYFLTAVPLFGTFISMEVVLSARWKLSRLTVNWLSSLLVTAAVFLLISGSALLGDGRLGYILIVVGLATAVSFFAIDKRSRQPLLRLSSIWSNSKYARALASQLLVYSAAFGMTFLFSLYLQIVKGFTSQDAGIMLIISPILMAAIAPLSGRLADRYPPARLAALGTLLITISLLMASQISAGTALTYLVAVLAIQGVGLGLFSAPNLSLILHSVQKHELNQASALSAKTRSLGMVASMTVVVLFLSLHLGGSPIAQPGGDYHEILFGYLSVVESSFVVHAALACLAAALFVVRARRVTRTEDPS